MKGRKPAGVTARPTITDPSAETPRADSATKSPDEALSARIPPAGVHAKARELEPTMVRPAAEMARASLWVLPGRTPRSWGAPALTQRTAWRKPPSVGLTPMITAPSGEMLVAEVLVTPPKPGKPTM